jgi:hypothetical protein
MTWNHRVIFHREKDARLSYFAVHECHYNEGEKIPHSWTSEPIRLIEDSVDDMRVTLTRILMACNQPILEIKGSKLIAYTTKNRSAK